MSPDDLSTPDTMAVERARYETHCLTEADRCLAEQGLRVDGQGRAYLTKAIGFAVQRATLALREVTDQRLASSAVFPRASHLGTPGSRIGIESYVPPKISFALVVSGWRTERHPTEKTAYYWKRVVEEIQNFVRFDDAQRLIFDDLVRWKASLIERESSTKTIRDGKIAPVRATLQWGLDDRELSTDVAQRLTIKVKVKPGSTRRGFTEEEAKRVLRVAAAEDASSTRRVPWIRAYTGARV